MDTASGVRAVTRSEQDRFEAAMTVAFSADALARWCWPDPLEYLNVFIPLVTLFGGKSFDHGSAYVVGDYFGVAQWLPPGIHPDDEPLNELLEKNMSGPRYGEVLKLFEKMAENHPQEPHWYVPLIGVDPIFQGRGYGSQLMKHALAVCDRDQQLAYLEATSPASRTFYERHGFKAFAEFQAADSPMIYPMLREPQ